MTGVFSCGHNYFSCGFFQASTVLIYCLCFRSMNAALFVIDSCICVPFNQRVFNQECFCVTDCGGQPLPVGSRCTTVGSRCATVSSCCATVGSRCKSGCGQSCNYG